MLTLSDVYKSIDIALQRAGRAELGKEDKAYLRDPTKWEDQLAGIAESCGLDLTDEAVALRQILGDQQKARPQAATQAQTIKDTRNSKAKHKHALSVAMREALQRIGDSDMRTLSDPDVLHDPTVSRSKPQQPVRLSFLWRPKYRDHRKKILHMMEVRTLLVFGKQVDLGPVRKILDMK